MADGYDIQNPDFFDDDDGGGSADWATPQPDIASQLWPWLLFAFFSGVLFIIVPIFLVRLSHATILGVIALVLGIIGLAIGGFLCISNVLFFFMGNAEGVFAKQDEHRNYIDDRDE